MSLFMRLVLVSFLSLSACGQAPSATEYSTTTTAAVVTDSGTGAAYAYSGNPFCWTDQVKTNGPSFQASGNSHYLCHTVGGGAQDGQTFKIRFYRDGTVSYQRRDVGETLYTPFVNTNNCHLGFDNSSHSVRYVNLEGAVLDASKYLTSSPTQSYYANPPTVTDQFALACLIQE